MEKRNPNFKVWEIEYRKSMIRVEPRFGFE